MVIQKPASSTLSKIQPCSTKAAQSANPIMRKLIEAEDDLAIPAVLGVPLVQSAT
jgi:hypothetical protein